jgi:hypothetical protein
MIDYASEYPVLQAAAEAHGVDPWFLCAIRQHENGGAGRQLGVMDPSAKTFEQQAAEAANTVAHRLTEYLGNPLVRVATVSGVHRLRYTDEFIQFFAWHQPDAWAPVGAANDPGHLNESWPSDVLWLYGHIVLAGRWPAPPPGSTTGTGPGKA